MKQFLSIFLVILAFSCAQINPLTGGEKDVTAPKIIESKSFPKQGQLNYTRPEINLVFDEFIVLKNPLNTIAITPQPKIAPSVTSKNKKLKIVFNEPLLPNTTYSISFNGAIADFSESNDSLFQYVFSTGSFIDSLQFSGSVVNAYTNKPEENILVGLYPENDTIKNDSLPYKIKPTYITQTTKTGDFNINYIKNGSYQAFAYTDINKNLLFEPAIEKLGFLDSINCCSDTLSENNKFRLFEPAKTGRGIKSTALNYPGQLTIIFKEKQPASFKLTHSAPLLQEETKTADSVIFWLTEPYTSKSFFVFQQENNMDTLKPILKNLPKTQDYVALTVSDNLHEGKILPMDTLSLTFAEPIRIANKKLIKVFNKDSISLPFESFVKNIRSLQILPSDSASFFTIDSSAIQSTLTASSNPYLTGSFTKHPKSYYGKLLVKLRIEDSSAYILELLDLKGNLIRKIEIIENIDALTFDQLLPSKYQLRLVKDTDANGKWTTGDLTKHQQPEKVFYFEKSIKIRSNWDMEIEWIVEELTP